MISNSTCITFPGQSTTEKSTILLAQTMKSHSSDTMIFLEKTPFHPVNPHWPDQPEDKGTITIGSDQIPIKHCFTAVMNKNSQEILLDTEVKIKRDDPNWFFLVAHIIDSQKIKPLSSLVGKQALLNVDKTYRLQLSQAHTACHISALALNKTLISYWNKPYQPDALGHSDLVHLAITKTVIQEQWVQDTFRIGKSARKKGFDALSFFEHIKTIEDRTNVQINEWLRTPIHIDILPKIALLHETISWICHLPDGIAKISCGGTHITQIKPDNHIKITLEKKEDVPEFTMVTQFS